MSDSVQVQVETLRRKLLDLSLRNRMLNFKHSKRVGINVVGEDSVQVHRLLVEEGKRMSFVGKPEPPKRVEFAAELPGYDDPVAIAELRQAAIEELDGFLENPVMAVSQMDTRLNTEEFESILQAKLRTIQREARLANEELGIDTLFLTLGQLEWREIGSERSLRAPLLFIPVHLEKQANGSIKMAHAGADTGDNLPLRAKMHEFNLKLPAYDDEQGLAVYFDSVRSTVRKMGDWSVLQNEIALGFFNYEKYAMYVDLGGEHWPEERRPWMHEDLEAVLGVGYDSPDSPIHDHTFLDDYRPVAECHEVYDADSSQTLAMLRAAAGLSLVIEGPPGTGKSQTITNIIAEAVEAGKKVLFVSAKRAALEVVKRRLTDAGLGSVCLDLHDKLTNRKEFYAELKRTAESSLRLRDEQERVDRLTELRDLLNKHVNAVNDPMTEFGCTPFEAMARLATLPKEGPEDREGRIAFDQIRHWDARMLRAHMPLVGSLEARLADVGVPTEHPFWSAEIDYLDPGRKLDLSEQLRAAVEATSRATAAVRALSGRLQIETPQTFGEIHAIARCVQISLAAPPLEGVNVVAGEWVSEEPCLTEAVARLRAVRSAMSNRKGEVTHEAWSQRWDSALRAYEIHAAKWYRFLFGDFRRARKELASALTVEAPRSALDQRDLLRELVEFGSARAWLNEHGERLHHLLGVQWQSERTDPDILQKLCDWILPIQKDVLAGEISRGFLDFLTGQISDSSLPAALQEVEEMTSEALASIARLTGTLRINVQGDSLPMEDLEARLEAWQDRQASLPSYIAYANVRRQAIESGLQPVTDVADRWPLAGSRLSCTVERSYFEGVVRQAMAERPELRDFDRERQERAISEFAKLDDFKLEYNRARVRLAHQRRLPSFGSAAGSLLILRQQCELTRKHKPIRWTMSRAGEAVMHIKPVFMMSPLSVAIHLPPDMPAFDMVIFDEASQVRPEDALCAIIRGKQTIVVGDTRQMPPTSFFDRVIDDDDPEDEGEDESAIIGQQARNMESVLSLMSAAVPDSMSEGVRLRVRRPDLRWHYRSLHPTLIQPSNEMFYGGRLVVFPSAGTMPEGKRIGVVFHHLPEAVYEGGATKRINRLEAERVVEAIVIHMRDHMDESLMVAAMNKPQADLIYSLLSIHERTSPELFARFHSRHPHEPLDVKNLENVQGDERDVVFISVTYGRDASGAVLQRFGPLLSEGGERRLNVLISRSRRRCEVFSSLTADDIRVEGVRPGLQAFKNYLHFAQRGQMPCFAPTGEEAESPFEEEVIEALRQRGFEVDSQVGSEGYRIDLAIVDPANPGSYLVGVECDGVTYHSARSARDRDKLRQRVLEQRGWKLHRIWSCDWWQDRDGEIDRLLRAVAGAEQLRMDEEPPITIELVDEDQRAPVRVARPYVGAPAFVGLPADASLLQYGKEVVEIEGPIHHELLLARLCVALGSARLTRGVRAHLEGLIARLGQTGQIRRLLDAYVVSDSQSAEPRNWSDRPPDEKLSDLVPQVEIAAALRAVVDEAFGISREDAVRGALALLGFRATSNARDRTAQVLQKMVEGGAIVEDKEVLRPAAWIRSR